MRKYLIEGFYGNDSGYRGVTSRRVKQLTKDCEKKMLQWLQQFVDKNITNLIDDLKQKLLQQVYQWLLILNLITLYVLVMISIVYLTLNHKFTLIKIKRKTCII